MSNPRKRQDRAGRDKLYNQTKRDKAAARFYASIGWKRAREKQLATHPICQRCNRVMAVHVHHIKPLELCTPKERVAPFNLKSLCKPCHPAQEAEDAAAREESEYAGPAVVGIYKPDPKDSRYYYDERTAERPIKFIERFCRHYEGRKFAGKPFILLEWQKEIVRAVFGWKVVGTDARRFTEVYIASAKGTGKTPFLAGLGLYMLLGDGEPGAHVVSMASVFEQANLTFDAGKKFIDKSSELSDVDSIQVQQFIIKAPGDSKWTTVSGDPTGRSGPRPSCILADELHEWKEPTAQGFDMLSANMFKRQQPLIIMATNAGPNQNCYVWKVHKKARGVLSGELDLPHFFPVIFEADRSIDWTSEAAAKAANPSLGQIVDFEEKIKPEQANGESRYRRLFLTQFVAAEEKFLDVTEWDRISSEPLSDQTTAGLALYVGLDMSQGDDLCSASYVYTRQDRFYGRSSFWLPKRTAQHYYERNGHPYFEWASWGDIELLDEPTISTAVQERIAAEIIATHRVQPIAAVCYDRAYSSHVIAALVKAGIECRPVGQGWGVSAGTAELERRVKERSYQHEPNAVMRFCVENAQVKSDVHGNKWPVKPLAKGSYAGQKSAKIDGVVSLVTALQEARAHEFPPERKVWRGSVSVVKVK